MFARNGALVVGLYLLIAVVVSVAGYVLYLHYGGASLDASMATGPDPQTSAARRNRSLLTKNAAMPAATPYNLVAVAQANERINEMQLTLQRTSAALEHRTQALNKKSDECRSLRAELDTSMAFALELLDGQSSTAASEEDAERDLKKLDAELKRLRAALAESEMIELQQAEEVEMLRMALDGTSRELAETQEQAQRELVALFEEQQMLETAAASALVNLGATAVSALVELLSDERAHVRIWSARVLGEIGPDAKDAVRPLSRLLSDRNENVRRQARKSLASIE